MVFSFACAKLAGTTPQDYLKQRNYKFIERKRITTKAGVAGAG